jgi:SSS family solute:Na+ symporter
MAAADWAIIGLSSLGLVIFSLYSVKHMKGVADFLAAGRLGGRYLLTISGGMSGIGAVSAVALFEMYYQAGFVPCWWSLMSIPVGVAIIMTGYVYYRFRESRALTN